MTGRVARVRRENGISLSWSDVDSPSVRRGPRIGADYTAGTGSGCDGGNTPSARRVATPNPTMRRAPEGFP